MYGSEVHTPPAQLRRDPGAAGAAEAPRRARAVDVSPLWLMLHWWEFDMHLSVTKQLCC